MQRQAIRPNRGIEPERLGARVIHDGKSFFRAGTLSLFCYR